MSTFAPTAADPAVCSRTILFSRLSRDEDGSTAVEFSLIAVPFVMMLLGIISVCLYFFTVLELDNAVWNATRDVRTGIYSTGGTGKAQTYIAPPSDPTDTTAMAAWDAQRKTLLRNAICNQLRDPSTCQTKIRVIMTTFNKGDPIVKPNCRNTDGTLIGSSTYVNTDPDAFVVVTACYGWDFGGNLPFFKIGNLPDGSFLVQATNAFVTEKYK